MKTRIPALLLTLALCLGLLASPAMAAGNAVEISWLPEGIVPTELLDTAQFYWFPADRGGVFLAQSNGRYGYINQNGKVVIPFEYDMAGPFSEGLATVWKDNRCGLINRSGEIVTWTDYDDIESFYDGIATIWKNGRCGCMDSQGKVIVPPRYDGFSGFYNGLAEVMLNNQYGYVDKSGREVIPVKYAYTARLDSDIILVAQGDWWVRGVIDASTYQFLIPLEYDSIEWAFGTEDRLWVEKNGKYGLMDTRGHMLTPLEYDYYISGFYSDRAAVSKNFKSGYIDHNGQLVIPMYYDDCGDFSYNSLAPVCKNYKWGAIDTSGALVIPLKYDDMGEFCDGLAIVTRNGLQGCVNESGQEVIPLQYDNLEFLYSASRICMEKNGKWGVLSCDGKVIIPPEYDSIDMTDDFYILERDGLLGLADADGRVLFAPQFDDVRSHCSLGLLVEKDGKYGCLSFNGQWVLPIEYDEISAANFQSGSSLAVVRKGNTSGLVDTYSGQFVLPMEYDELVCAGRYDVGVVCRNGRYGIFAGPRYELLASPSNETVMVDGEPVEFQMYSLWDGSVNFIRVRDLAALLNGTAAQFDVRWENEQVHLVSKTPYSGGTEPAPFHTDMPATLLDNYTYVDGEALFLDALQIEYNGGGYTYYMVRDLAEALDFNVGWSEESGIFLETDKPYDPNN